MLNFENGYRALVFALQISVALFVCGLLVLATPLFLAAQACAHGPHERFVNRTAVTLFLGCLSYLAGLAWAMH